MDNLSGLRKRFSQRISDIERKLLQEQTEIRRRVEKYQKESAESKKAAFEDQQLNVRRESDAEKEKTIAEKFRRFEENYEKEIERLQDELSHALKKEVELNTEIKKLKEKEKNKVAQNESFSSRGPQTDFASREKHPMSVNTPDEKVLERISRSEKEYKEEINKLCGELARSKENEEKIKTSLAGVDDEVKNLRKKLEDKEKYLEGMMKSTAMFLDSALKQEQAKIEGLANKTARILFEKKEYEVMLNNLRDDHETLKKELGIKDGMMQDVLSRKAGLGNLSSVESNSIDKPESEAEHELKFKAEPQAEPEETVRKPNPPEPSLQKKTNEPEGEKEMTYDERVAQESLSVINKFIGWFGKPMVGVDDENIESSEDKKTGNIKDNDIE